MEKRCEVEMSPAEFLADIEVAVTNRDLVLPRPVASVDGRDGSIAAAGAPPADAHKSDKGA